MERMMGAKFTELCENLKINLPSPSEEDLKKLIHWCETALSTDLKYAGSLQERFDAYQVLASDFVEQIEPTIKSHDLTTPIPSFNGMSPLQLLVNVGLDMYLKQLHPSIEQIKTKINGTTLLQLAVARGHLHTTEALLSLGANPDETLTKGEPLLFATLMLPINHDEKIIQNKQSIYRLLNPDLKHKLAEKNQSGDTILHIMSVFGYPELVKHILTTAKELAFIPNNTRHYPIHSAILNTQHECVQLLIAEESMAQLVDGKGRNALHYAAIYGDPAMIRICLNSSLSKDSVDKRNQTPLILASIANQTVTVHELLAVGAGPNLTDDLNRTALHYAVESNAVDIVKQLLAIPDIQVNISDTDAKNPLDLVQCNSPEGSLIRALLIEKGAGHAQSSSEQTRRSF